MATILLVEDEKNQQILYGEELREEGFEIMIAGTGEEAIEVVKRSAPDLVVLDVMMAGMDGIEALGRILAVDHRLPVILHTAYSNYKDNFMTWAADAYVVKSGDLSALKAEIKRVLQKRGKSQS